MSQLHSAAVSEGTEEFDGTESGLAGASSRLDSSRGATPNFFPPVVDFPGAQAAMASAGPRQQQQYRLLLRELKSLLRSTCIALRCVVYHVVVLPLQPLPSPKHSSSHPHPQPSAAQEGDGGLSAAPPSTSRSSRGAEVAGAASSSRRASFDVRLLPRGQQLAPADLEFLSEAFFATVGCALGHAKVRRREESLLLPARLWQTAFSLQRPRPLAACASVGTVRGLRFDLAFATRNRRGRRWLRRHLRPSGCAIAGDDSFQSRQRFLCHGQLEFAFGGDL